MCHFCSQARKDTSFNSEIDGIFPLSRTLLKLVLQCIRPWLWVLLMILGILTPSFLFSDETLRTCCAVNSSWGQLVADFSSTCCQVIYIEKMSASLSGLLRMVIVCDLRNREIRSLP